MDVAEVVLAVLVVVAVVLTVEAMVHRCTAVAVEAMARLVVGTCRAVADTVEDIVVDAAAVVVVLTRTEPVSRPDYHRRLTTVPTPKETTV